jgi:hypothetical protein
MINYTSQTAPDTLDEMANALLKHQALTLLHRKLRSMPNYANRDAHICKVEGRIHHASVQIEILANRLILLG